MFSFVLALALVAQGPFDAVTIRPAGGPAVLYHQYPTPLVALRLAVPLPPDVPEGGLELLQELARPAAEAAASRLGASLELTREGDTGVYRLIGPAASFDALAAILRGALGEPELGAATLARARAAARERVLGALEQPLPRLRRLLRHQLAGGSGEPAPATDRLGPESIRRLRWQLFQSERLRLVMVGDIPAEVIGSAFGGWAPPAPSRADYGDEAVGETRATPQAHHDWAALAYPLDAMPAAAAVAAELVARRARRSALRSGGAEAWLEPGGPILMVHGAAAPGDVGIATAAGIGRLETRGGAGSGPAPAVGRYLRRMIAEAAALVNATAVEAAASEIRTAMLLSARGPGGRADLIGRLADAGGAGELLAALERVHPADVRAALDAALDAPAYLAEVRP